MPTLLRIASITACTLAIAAASTAANAQQAPKPEQVIKWRQSAFQVVAWNTGRIKASLDGSYNKDEVLKAAATIAAIASNLSPLFPAGTEQGKGWHETGAKPELFKETQKVGELASSFSKEASELARVAAAGDTAVVKDQFGKLTRSCKACHDDFRAKD